MNVRSHSSFTTRGRKVRITLKVIWVVISFLFWAWLAAGQECANKTNIPEVRTVFSIPDRAMPAASKKAELIALLHESLKNEATAVNDSKKEPKLDAKLEKKIRKLMKELEKEE